MTDNTKLSFYGNPFNIELTKYKEAIKAVQDGLYDDVKGLVYASDNFITWNRSIGFITQDWAQEIFADEEASDTEKSILWRTYLNIYFAGVAKTIEGDFMELGVYKGTTAYRLLQAINFAETGKNYYLYDLFEWNKDSHHINLPGLADGSLYEFVINRFKDYPCVKVIKGNVPDTFEQALPEKVAFAHIDMNYFEPEVAAVKAILPRLSPGGIIIFDDYGWWTHREQKQALDPVVSGFGQSILELPTGQGMLLKTHTP